MNLAISRYFASCGGTGITFCTSGDGSNMIPVPSAFTGHETQTTHTTHGRVV